MRALLLCAAVAAFAAGPMATVSAADENDTAMVIVADPTREDCVTYLEAGAVHDDTEARLAAYENAADDAFWTAAHLAMRGKAGLRLSIAYRRAVAAHSGIVEKLRRATRDTLRKRADAYWSLHEAVYGYGSPRFLVKPDGLDMHGNPADTRPRAEVGVLRNLCQDMHGPFAALEGAGDPMKAACAVYAEASTAGAEARSGAYVSDANRRDAEWQAEIAGAWQEAAYMSLRNTFERVVPGAASTTGKSSLREEISRHCLAIDDS